MIHCDTHGRTPATYVCRHLFGGTACGYHANPASPEDPWPDAWCDACEEAFQAGGDEWTEDAEEAADIMVLCSGCYEAARNRNRLVPPHARGAAARLNAAEVDALFHQAHHAAESIQAASDKRWDWRALPRWDSDPEAGTIVFSDESGSRVSADVRTVGSYSREAGSFQWVWETYEEDSPEARAIAPLRGLTASTRRAGRRVHRRVSDSKRVTCGAHGDTPATYACRHVTVGSACGFHTSADNPSDAWPDAWCDLCEEAVQATGGAWTDASEKVAEIKLMCTHCYDAAKSRNASVPPLARGKAARLTEAESARCAITRSTRCKRFRPA
jgi:hypothetical protein